MIKTKYFRESTGIETLSQKVQSYIEREKITQIISIQYFKFESDMFFTDYEAVLTYIF